MKRALGVLTAEDGSTLEAFLRQRLGWSSQAARDAIGEGGVHVDRRRVRDPGHLLCAGQKVRVHRLAPAAPPTARIVYEDEDLLVVDKPANLPVAATRQSAARALDALLRAAGRPYVGLLHRLDREASGLVVFSRRRAANPALHAELAGHRAGRGYLALVAGAPRADQGRWSSPVAGRPAGTRFAVRERLGASTLLALELETGRTHQIRVHAAAAGLALVGDARHGGPPAARLMLHAERLSLRHPRSGAPLRFEAPPPEDFAAVLAAWRGQPPSGGLGGGLRRGTSPATAAPTKKNSGSCG